MQGSNQKLELKTPILPQSYFILVIVKLEENVLTGPLMQLTLTFDLEIVAPEAVGLKVEGQRSVGLV